MLVDTGQISTTPESALVDVIIDRYAHHEWKLRRDLLQSYMQFWNMYDGAILELSHSKVSNI